MSPRREIREDGERQYIYSAFTSQALEGVTGVREKETFYSFGALKTDQGRCPILITRMEWERIIPRETIGSEDGLQGESEEEGKAVMRRKAVRRKGRMRAEEEGEELSLHLSTPSHLSARPYVAKLLSYFLRRPQSAARARIMAHLASGLRLTRCNASASRSRWQIRLNHSGAKILFGSMASENLGCLCCRHLTKCFYQMSSIPLNYPSIFTASFRTNGALKNATCLVPYCTRHSLERGSVDRGVVIRGSSAKLNRDTSYPFNNSRHLIRSEPSLVTQQSLIYPFLTINSGSAERARSPVLYHWLTYQIAWVNLRMSTKTCQLVLNQRLNSKTSSIIDQYSFYPVRCISSHPASLHHEGVLTSNLLKKYLTRGSWDEMLNKYISIGFNKSVHSRKPRVQYDLPRSLTYVVDISPSSGDVTSAQARFIKPKTRLRRANTKTKSTLHLLHWCGVQRCSDTKPKKKKEHQLLVIKTLLTCSGTPSRSDRHIPEALINILERNVLNTRQLISVWKLVRLDMASNVQSVEWASRNLVAQVDDSQNPIMEKYLYRLDLSQSEDEWLTCRRPENRLDSASENPRIGGGLLDISLPYAEINSDLLGQRYAYNIICPIIVTSRKAMSCHKDRLHNQVIPSGLSTVSVPSPVTHHLHMSIHILTKSHSNLRTSHPSRVGMNIHKLASEYSAKLIKRGTYLHADALLYTLTRHIHQNLLHTIMLVLCSSNTPSWDAGKLVVFPLFFLSFFHFSHISDCCSFFFFFSSLCLQVLKLLLFSHRHPRA
ncbi:hypothetical protein VP01_2240g2 [Puccinia sorghi]|uniref:Uncharacterized protein n=1 Tax=Puccinia sorghi TaxID=27349 RepID=A0A0L6V8Q9_9BASI|nr:hypothetical protein VP01_2240g2 [Puccinia sorghi]